LLVDRIESESPQKGGELVPPGGVCKGGTPRSFADGKIERAISSVVASSIGGLAVRMANEWRQIVTLIALSATLIDAFSGDRHAGSRRITPAIIAGSCGRLQGNPRDPRAEFRTLQGAV